MPKRLLIWLGEEDSEDIPFVGEKFARLAQLAKIGLPTVPGFIVTSNAYKEFLEQNKLAQKIAHLQASLLEEKQAKAVQKEIEKSHLPQQLTNEILKAYLRLSGQLQHAPLLIISQHFPPIKIKGEANLLVALESLWRDSFIMFPGQDESILVQQNIPVTEEGVYHTEEMQTATMPKSEKHLVALENIAQLAKKHYYFPQSLHWVISKNTLYIVDIKEYTPSLEKQNTRVSPVTATKLYLDLTDANSISSIASMHADGVGNLRLDSLNDSTEEALAKEIASVSSAFSPRPVVCQVLTDGEIKAVKRAVRQLHLRNVWLMISSIRTVQDLDKAKQHLTSLGLYRSPTCKLWMSIDTPSSVMLIDEFLASGLDGIAINTDSLPVHTLAVDSSETETLRQFNKKDPSLLWSYERVLRSCHKHGIASSIFGASTDNPELLEKLIGWGITSVSVSPNALNRTREYIALFEKRLIDRI